MKTVDQERMENERAFGFKMALDLIGAMIADGRAKGIDDLPIAMSATPTVIVESIHLNLTRFYRTMPGVLDE